MNTDNVWLKLVLAPIWGLAFLMFLPFIGFYLTVQALFLKASTLFVIPAAAPAPGAAYLTGSEPGPGADDECADVQREIGLRRRHR